MGVQLSSEPISDTPIIVKEEAENSSLYNAYSRDEAGVSVFTETDSNADCNYTEYLINEKSEWNGEEILFNNSATTSTPAIIAPTSISNSQYYQVGYKVSFYLFILFT